MAVNLSEAVEFLIIITISLKSTNNFGDILMLVKGHQSIAPTLSQCSQRLMIRQ